VLPTRRTVSIVLQEMFFFPILIEHFWTDGRRPVYLYSLPVLTIGSIGVSLATNIPNLLFWRFLQALGAAPSLVVGAGVIGDIYKLEERGRAMSVFFAVSGHDRRI
jgi:MFS family permease